MSDNIERARALLADQVGLVQTVSIDGLTAHDVLRFAMATSDDNPAYSAGAAQQAEASDIVVPPLLLTSVREWGPGSPTALLEPDGTTTADVGRPNGLELRALGGGQSLDFHADVPIGVAITATFAVVDVQRRAGRHGDFLLVEVHRDYRDPAENLLVHCAETRILR